MYGDLFFSLMSTQTHTQTQKQEKGIEGERRERDNDK